MSLNSSRREEICRLASQISCQSLQLRDIVDNIYQRGQSPARPPLTAPSSSPGFAVDQLASGCKGGGGRRVSAAPQMGTDFSVNAKVTTGRPGRNCWTSQFLTVQVPVSMASQFMATQKLDAGELSARQFVSSLDSDEDLPEPAHPRPYEDDSTWEVRESNMLRLTQLLKVLIQELRSVTEYTKIDEPTLMAAAGVVWSGVPLTEVPAADAFATKVAASSIIGGMLALHSPASFKQLYAPPPQVKDRSSTKHMSSELVRGHVDLSTYFNEVASQVEALTQALNPFPPPARAPMAYRTLSPAGQQMKVRVEVQVDNCEGVSMASWANVIDRSSQPSAAASSAKGAGGLVQSDTMASLIASVNQLTNHMTQVQDLSRHVLGARPVPKRRGGLSISEEEDLRYCVPILTDNMAKMSRHLKKTLDEHTI
ncbi:hypothetical protein MTO96_024249 [Rhipicephalus appendiculatus]